MIATCNKTSLMPKVKLNIKNQRDIIPTTYLKRVYVDALNGRLGLLQSANAINVPSSAADVTQDVPFRSIALRRSTISK